MAFVTRAQIRSIATVTLNRRMRTADALLKEEIASVRSSYDVFLSHSYSDKTDIVGIKTLIEERGHTVYVDWIDDKKLDRTKVGKETAETLRQSMNKCSCLIYAYSPNIINSKWCPWELGYFDGMNGNAYVMPIVENQSDGYAGVEYVSLYKKITDGLSKSGKNLLWVEDGGSSVSLGKALSQANMQNKR